MLRKKIWLFLGLMLVLAGCGASAPSPNSPRSNPADASGGSSGAKFAGEPVGDSAAGEGDAPSAQKAPAAAPPQATSTLPSAGRSNDVDSRRESSAAPAPESRPGLGTEWGESRTSRVHDVSFVRDASRPFALAQLHYNDRRGVDAQANLAAQRDVRRDVSFGGGAVTVSIRDANGNALEAVRAGDRTLVVGQAGQRYSIVLQNHTSHRFEAVATVDGLDVINGKSGSFDNRGYVLMPFATLEIDGFRQSTSSVAAFRFASVGESYAAQMGKARNVGVIGVAFFAERGDSFVPESESRLRDTASPFPADPRFAQPPRR